ncbi:MAG: transketolase [Oscillospiraceae bacterium]|nr:transketolase [Oscillospiraceae bacterium]
MDTLQLQNFARDIRVTTLEAFKTPLFGHIGGAMSICDVLAVLYGSVMNVDAANPLLATRDKLVLSKGHAGPALYATLCLKGYFSREMLTELNQGGGRLPSHVDRTKTPGVDMTAGSLGQGFSAACGIALGDRISGLATKTYCIVGDGELDEGQNWEAMLFAAHYKLDNLTLFVDYNKRQLDGYTDDVMSLGDLRAKLEAFGFVTFNIDGHNVKTIQNAITRGQEQAVKLGKPLAVILNTVKGKGCDFAEATGDHHMTFTLEQLETTIAKLQSEVYTV